MRKVAFFIIALIICSCTNENNLPINSSYISSNLSFSDSTLSVLEKYAFSMGNDTSLIYQIFLEQRPDSTKMILTYTPYKFSLKYYIPDGYVRIKKNLFLVYLGINRFLNTDSVLISTINKEISQIKTRDELSPFSIAIVDGLTWEILFCCQNSGFKIIKTNHCEYNKTAPPFPPS